jgi:hypothetical protein
MANSTIDFDCSSDFDAAQSGLCRAFGIFDLKDLIFDLNAEIGQFVVAVDSCLICDFVCVRLCFRFWSSKFFKYKVTYALKFDTFSSPLTLVNQ